MNGDLVPAEPVLDGELVGEPKTLVQRLGSGWRRTGVSAESNHHDCFSVG